MKIKTGCCGFPVKKNEYYKKFQLVEIQKSFYHIPEESTVLRWREAAPEGFEFTMKAWQLITHPPEAPTYDKVNLNIADKDKDKYGFFKPTPEVFAAWEKTQKIAAALRARLIVFQCPASFNCTEEHKNNMRNFFNNIDSVRYKFIWEPPANWPEHVIKDISAELGLVHCVDPFKEKILEGDIRYIRLHGLAGYKYRYTGIDLKKLRDFCENEANRAGEENIYILFDNAYMMSDALRFQWIVENTGRIKEQDTGFLKSLCAEIESREEDEKVQILSREAERIVSLILYTDYKKVDIEIETAKLKEMCLEMFPEKDYLYDMIYGQRFMRLWAQFREIEEQD